MGRRNLSEVRRKEIVVAFYKVAKKIGLENVSIAKVADEMSISKGLILHYFESKESLLLSLNDYILEEYLRFINSEEHTIIDSREKLQCFIKALFSKDWANYIDDGVYYSFYALIYRDLKIHEKFQAFLQALQNVLKEKLLMAKKNGIICNDNIDDATKLIFAIIDGAYYRLGNCTDKVLYEKTVKLYREYALQILCFTS